MLTRYLVLVFGEAESHAWQANLAALSLLAHAPAPMEVVIASDRPQRYAWLCRDPRVRVHVVDQATMAAWRGAHGFFWRIKLECIRSQIDGSAAVVYLDSDVLARRDLAPLVERLARGEVAMHEPEQRLASSKRRGDRALYALTGGKSWGGLAVDQGTVMWNAGVVGVGPAGKELVERALGTCDTLCAGIGNHTLNEQFSLSLALAATGRLIPAKEWLDHYWGNKPGYQTAITQQLSDMLIAGMSPAEAAELVRAKPIQLPVHVRRRRWHAWVARRLNLPS